MLSISNCAATPRGSPSPSRTSGFNAHTAAAADRDTAAAALEAAAAAYPNHSLRGDSAGVDEQGHNYHILKAMASASATGTAAAAASSTQGRAWQILPATSSTAL